MGYELTGYNEFEDGSISSYVGGAPELGYLSYHSISLIMEPVFKLFFGRLPDYEILVVEYESRTNLKDLRKKQLKFFLDNRKSFENLVQVYKKLEKLNVWFEHETGYQMGKKVGKERFFIKDKNIKIYQKFLQMTNPYWNNIMKKEKTDLNVKISDSNGDYMLNLDVAKIMKSLKKIMIKNFGLNDEMIHCQESIVKTLIEDSKFSFSKNNDHSLELTLTKYDLDLKNEELIPFLIFQKIFSGICYGLKIWTVLFRLVKDEKFIFLWE